MLRCHCERQQHLNLTHGSPGRRVQNAFQEMITFAYYRYSIQCLFKIVMVLKDRDLWSVLGVPAANYSCGHMIMIWALGSLTCDYNVAVSHSHMFTIDFPLWQLPTGKVNGEASREGCNSLPSLPLWLYLPRSHWGPCDIVFHSTSCMLILHSVPCPCSLAPTCSSHLPTLFSNAYALSTHPLASRSHFPVCLPRIPVIWGPCLIIHMVSGLWQQLGLLGLLLLSDLSHDISFFNLIV